MSTIPCTKNQYFAALLEFKKVYGNKNSTQSEVALAHKCVCLHYFGLIDVTDDDIKKCALFLQVDTLQAMRRGYHLECPELSEKK